MATTASTPRVPGLGMGATPGFGGGDETSRNTSYQSNVNDADLYRLFLELLSYVLT
jgi:hypothetical protein